MIIIQRRISDSKGRSTPAIGFYKDLSDTLIGALWDGQRKVRYAKQTGKSITSTINYWEEIFRKQGMFVKAIRKQDKQGQAAFAWGTLEIEGGCDEDEEM